jgi:DNA-binding XRE family transcriptional regulator
MSDTTHARDAQARLRKTAKHEIRHDAKDCDDPLCVAFARNLRQTRKRANMKGYVAADLLGVSKSAWSQWESGKRLPSLTMLEAIASCLNVQPCSLLKRKGPVCFADSEVHAL